MSFRRLRARRALVGAALVACGWNQSAQGLIKTWALNGSGLWATGANWAGGTVPVAGDTMVLAQGPFVVTYDSTVAPVGFGNATISNGMSMTISSGTYTGNAGAVFLGSGATAGSF